MYLNPIYAVGEPPTIEEILAVVTRGFPVSSFTASPECTSTSVQLTPSGLAIT